MSVPSLVSQAPDPGNSRSSTMHSSVNSALQVEEVLDTIFSHLSPYAGDRQTALTSYDQLGPTIGKDFSHLGVESSPCAANQRALVHSSRVSRSFADHALKVLWRTLPNLRPLYHLLEIMDFSYADLDTGMPIHTFACSVQPSSHIPEWRRFRWYASCVVSIRGVIDHIALEEWSDKGGPPLLPELQRARLRFDPRCAQRMLRMLPSPLRDLTLDFDSPNHLTWKGSRMSTADILSSVAIRAPSVEVMNLTFRTYPEDLCPVLPRFSCLQTLVVTGWMTPSLHQAIEALESLETLYVKLYWTRAEAGLQDLQLRRYSSVKTLAVLTLSEPVIFAFRSTEFPALERLRLEVWPHSSDATDGLTQAMESLRKHAPRLRSISLTARSAAVHGDRPPPRLTAVIEPLVRKPTLENVSVSLEDNYSFALTREDILSFPSAWPHLTTLHLAHAPLRTSDPAPSIRVFFDFIQACPRLETLVLCARFDCTSRTEWQNVFVSPHPALRGLFLGLDPETNSYSPERTWLALAAALDRCVPRLDVKSELVRTEVVGAQAVETWKGVMRHMQDLRVGVVQAPGSPDW